MYDELRVVVREALELVLVQVHDEELVCRRQLHGHLCELFVEVADVSARFLMRREEKDGVAFTEVKAEQLKKSS